MVSINPLVSVVVPLYNYSQYIGDCIQSIKNQDYDNYELIVIDDCSTDKSYKVAKGFENGRIKVIKTEVNSGYSKAKNEGIIVSQGEMITCLDADDMMTKTSITRRVKALLKNNVDMIHARAIDVTAKMTLNDCYKMNMSKARRTEANVHAQTVMLKRGVHIKYGLYDEDLRSKSDKEMWRRIHGRIEQVKLEKDVAYYRLHNKSMMKYRKKHARYNKEVTKIFQEHLKMRREQGITKENTRFLEK